MIVQWFAEMIFKILTALLDFINLPTFDFSVLVDYIIALFELGSNIVSFLVPDNVINVGIPILLSIISLKYGYLFIMWILHKIPMAGIK